MNWFDSIQDYTPCNEQEEKDKAIFLQCIQCFDDILTRNNTIAHFTSSAFVLNHDEKKVLMVHHNIFHAWSWMGGHADGDADLLHVAVRETREETGLKHVFPVRNDIVSIDVIPVFGHIKKGDYVPPHLHLSVAYLLKADEKEKLIIKPDENSGVQWIPIDKINQYSHERHMIKIYEKIVSKRFHGQPQV